jgi:hypothetical protein
MKTLRASVRTLPAVLAAFALAFTSGCGSGLGPAKLTGTRMDYNVSVQRSSNEEMLLNLVRLKYFDLPMFMQVGSIASTYNFGLTAGSTATFPDQRDYLRSIYGTYTPNVSATYGDTPTVTSTPYQGQTYAQQLLLELDFDRFVMLYRSGWDIDYLMRVLVARIGKIEHYYDARTGFTPQSHTDFLDLTEIFARMDDYNNFDIVTVSQGDAKFTIIQLRFNKPEEADRIEALLGIKLARVMHANATITAKLKLVPVTDFNVRAEAKNEKDMTDLPIRLRNCYRAMDMLGQGVDVPKELAVKRVGFNFREQTKDIMDIRQARTRPANAFVAVQYRDYWYYIDENDDRSREVLQLMHAIFALQAGDLPKNVPVLTVPTR